jgi:hypothetical protein
MAFFSDEEEFANNQLTAGELDMKVGYSAHYSDWSDDEGQGVSVRMWDGAPGTTGTASDLESGETGLPANDAWLIAVDDPDQFLANTQYAEDGNASCGGANGNNPTDADDVEQPVIDLGDVKPGDFGEVTFDFALCDNPGFVWLNGELRSKAENGITEPEAKDPDEEESAERPASQDSASDVVELLDVVQAAYWIDDGNNYQNGNESPAFVGSLRDALTELSAGNTNGNDANKGALLPGDIAAEQGGGMGGNCFSAGTTHSVAFAWWVPVDHGNEIQGDSATFDLGFYTEQCRHNSGSEGQGGGQVVSVRSDPSEGVRSLSPPEPWITATVDPGTTTSITVQLNGDVYGGGSSGSGEWPSNPDSYVVEAVIDTDNDGLNEAQSDDFRIGFGSANSGARNKGIANSTSGASGDGGYIRRNTGTSSPSRTDTAEEDISGFSATESSDKLTYTFEIDWTSSDLPSLSSAPSTIILKEAYGSDGGEGVAATPNSSNDGRGNIDNTTDASGQISL